MVLYYIPKRLSTHQSESINFFLHAQSSIGAAHAVSKGKVFSGITDMLPIAMCSRTFSRRHFVQNAI